MNLIDRDHLLKKANEEQKEGLITDDDLEVVYYELADEPVIDAVPVIRCKDCKWYLSNGIKSPFDIDGFDRWGCLANCQNVHGLTECSDESYCSEGERRTDG